MSKKQELIKLLSKQNVIMKKKDVTVMQTFYDVLANRRVH